MKVHIINHRCGDDEIEVKNGIRVNALRYTGSSVDAPPP